MAYINKCRLTRVHESQIGLIDRSTKLFLLPQLISAEANLCSFFFLLQGESLMTLFRRS